MPVHVHKEPDVYASLDPENCTDCRQPTRTWLTPHIPLCESCAQKRPDLPAMSQEEKRVALLGERKIHTSSMTFYQREELVRVLQLIGHKLDEVANMTDRQLHLTWLMDCQYIEKEEFEREFTACLGKPLFPT